MVGESPLQTGHDHFKFRGEEMAIYQTGGYRVKPEAVERVKQAIKVFVKHVQENEPGTKMYLAWQE